MGHASASRSWLPAVRELEFSSVQFICCAHARRIRGISIAKKGSPYSATERRVPELIPVLGSQPAGDVSHKPGGRLPLLSARPAVTPATFKTAATNFVAWWTELRWVRAVCLRLLPYSVATAICTRAFCAWVQHANYSANEPPYIYLLLVIFICMWSIVWKRDVIH